MKADLQDLISKDHVPMDVKVSATKQLDLLDYILRDRTLDHVAAIASVVAMLMAKDFTFASLLKEKYELSQFFVALQWIAKNRQ